MADPRRVVVSIDRSTLVRGLVIGVVAAAVFVPTWLIASSVGTLTSFTTNTPISSGDVNTNFALLTSAVDDNDGRLTFLESGTTPSSVARTQGGALADCAAIKAADAAAPSGVYWVDPNGGATTDAFRVHCDMSTSGGGWTLVTNVHPADGSVVAFTNLNFWLDDVEYGAIGNHFSHDYKSPAAWTLSGSELLVVVAHPPPSAAIIGWKHWTMGAQTFDSFFDDGPNTIQTTGVVASDVADVYAYEPIVRNATEIATNRSYNPNADRVRFAGHSYSPNSDDNIPGLGTHMNESVCGVGVNCYRYQDVELWMDTPVNTNLWCTPPQGVDGKFAYLGSDGGVGRDNEGEGRCQDHQQSPTQIWTYRIYVR